MVTAAVVLARLANAGFAVVTAAYCLLTYTPFAYQQFIKPHLVNGLSTFPVWHHVGFWIVWGVTALTMIRERPPGRGRACGVGYLAVMAAAGLVLVARPVLPSVENDGRGLLLAGVALLPPIWLAWYDHLATSPGFAPAPTSDGRVLNACLLAAGVVWAEQTLVAPWRLGQAGEITLSAPAAAFGAITSAVGHLVVFAALPIVIVGSMRMAREVRGGGVTEYWILAVLSGAVAALVSARLVFGAISFEGPAAWFLSVEIGAMTALVWSSVARRLSESGPGVTAFEAWIAPLPGGRSRTGAVTALIGLGVGSFAAIAAVMTFDWDFLVQRLIVLGVWLAAIAYSFRAVPAGGALSWPSLAAPACVAVPLFGASAVVQPWLTHLGGDRRFVPEFVLEGYVAVDPSYGLIRRLLRVPSPEDAAFYEELREKTRLAGVELAPVEIDFVRPLRPAATRPPHIILLVVDSLRRDYLSPYNPAVRFTPAIERFAADAVVFERTFARYGGTGLAVPALWTGGLVMNRQYVTPYGPMNTLEKLLDANAYRRVLSIDHITAQIVSADTSTIELDRGRPEMQYDLCGTLAEVSAGVPRAAWSERPLFVHTRSLNLHIAHVRRTPVPPGVSYTGFMAPVAATVERLDGCFGDFLRELRRRDLYDESIIVLTSDHGDSLGESLRWGHSYTMFPEVIRIPLIIRVPPRLHSTFTADRSSVSFSTDITPTLYRLLGYAPADLGPAFGAPLFRARGDRRPSGREQAHLLASSYGAVYGVLRGNGRYVYVADAVNNRDYAYAMADGSRERIGITPAERSSNRAFIRQQLEELAGVYQYGHDQ